MEQAIDWGFDFSYQEMAHALMEIFDFTISVLAQVHIFEYVIRISGGQLGGFAGERHD